MAIVLLLSQNFVVLVGIAMVIATPVAWLVMRNWLQDFAYRVEIRWWMLAGAGGCWRDRAGYHADNGGMACGARCDGEPGGQSADGMRGGVLTPQRF